MLHLYKHKNKPIGRFLQMNTKSKPKFNMPTTAYLHTGSNEGDRLQNLRTAVEWIEKRAGKCLKQSSIYETAAWGIEDQPDFLNQALAISTDRPPFELLDTLLAIEKDMGRQRRIKWGQRLIDIDLLFYGNIRIYTERLKIPHPFLQQRNFVLQPLMDIAPDLHHPQLGLSVRELAAQSEDKLWASVYAQS
jgi:2-amino-4-hydroxy-6-hydroxymethyldihydropteridine diphosphokinase